MKRVVPLYKYLLWETVKPIFVFYGIMVCLLTVLLLLPLIFPAMVEDAHGQISGLGLTTTIFLFVTGLNSFKSGFAFASSNGFTRRQYHLASALMLLTVGTGMTLLDAGLNALVSAIWPNLFVQWPQAYAMYSPFTLAAWQWTMNLLAVAGGLCITMAFYRLNKLGKLLLALSPVYLSLLYSLLDVNTGYAISHWVTAVLLGFRGTNVLPSVGISALSMAVTALLLLGLARLLIRGAPVKEQER